MFLNEIVFLNECIFISWNHYIFDVLYLTDKNLGLPVFIGFVEVRTYSTLQILCLTHIDHSAIFIKILIASWFFGETIYNHLQPL